MARITAGEIGSLTACTNGVLRFPLTNHPARDGAVFLDRDGVINRRIQNGYVTRLSEFEFLPEALPSMRLLSGMGRPVIVVSNQAAVAKRLITTRTLEQITTWFVEQTVAAGGRVNAVYYCPHAEADGCQCRKPKAGLFLQAAKDFGIDLTQSVMIGDSLSDAEAAKSVGIRTLLLEDGGLLGDNASDSGYEVVPDLRAAVAAIV